MNDKSELDASDQQKILAFFEANNVSTVCPGCGNRQWVLFEHIVLLPVWQGHAQVVNPSFGYPAVVACCTRCKFLRSHSALAIGVMPAAPAGGGDAL